MLRLIWIQIVLGVVAKKITLALPVMKHGSTASQLCDQGIPSHNCALSNITASFRTAQGAYDLEPIKHSVIVGLNSAWRTDLFTSALYNSYYKLHVSLVTSNYML
jgi:hypothetical protein